jgi:ubiquinone/menaquinone biosynthesis C-methylase UbiE
LSNEHILDKEEDFHDDWASAINIDDVMVDESFEACTSPENRLILNCLGNIKGKKLLELGCGAGEASVYFAKKGADVTATDISNEMLEVVKKVAAKHSVQVETLKAYSHTVEVEDETFDIVYAANLLHHVDIETTLKEALRVLKEGGLFVSWDPLYHNPLIHIYRNMATKVRTEDEHPIKMSELELFDRFFPSVEYDTAWFFTLWIFIKFFLIDRVDPNKERYWKKILTDAKELEKTYTLLEKVDRLFFNILPFMRRYCWNIIIIAKK